jgi:DNA-binding transcriptional ArsR family regulator
MHDDSVLPVLKALADPTRLSIIRRLVRERDGHASCGEVSTCSSLSQPAMSHHFKKLVDAGVISEQKRGTQKIYELNTDVLERMGLSVEKL